jgi:hypothetical protein
MTKLPFELQEPICSNGQKKNEKRRGETIRGKNFYAELLAKKTLIGLLCTLLSFFLFHPREFEGFSFSFVLVVLVVLVSQSRQFESPTTQLR